LRARRVDQMAMSGGRSVALLPRFAAEAGLTVNVTRDAATFMLVFSGFAHWPELFEAVVDDEEFADEEIAAISAAHAKLVAFGPWYMAFRAALDASPRFKRLRVDADADAPPQWLVFAQQFHREELAYRTDWGHIAAMYLCRYHGRGVPGLPERGEDEDDGEWLRDALGDRQLMADTIADVEQFCRDHPDVDIPSILFLAQCAHEGMEHQ